MSSRSSGSGPLSVDVITDESALATLRPEWERLWRGDTAADLFGSFDWVANLYEHFGTATSHACLVVSVAATQEPITGAGWSLRIFVVRDSGGAAVAIVPLVQVIGSFRRRRRRLLSTPVNAHAPRSGIVALRFDPEVAASLALALHERRDWDVLLLQGLPTADGRAALLATALSRRGWPALRETTAPSAYLRYGGSFEDHMAGAERGHFRRSIVKSTNGLQKIGELRIHCYRAGVDEVGEGIEMFMRVDAQSWKARSGESVAQSPALRAYYADLAGRLAAAGRVEVWVLFVGETPAAAFICPHDGRARYTLKSSFTEGFNANRSPSLVLLNSIVQQTWGTDTRGIDFVGKVAFLDRWATEDLSFRSEVFFRSRLAHRHLQASDLVLQTLARARSLATRVARRLVGGSAQVSPAVIAACGKADTLTEG